MIPSSLNGFFPGNKAAGTDKLYIVPVVGRDILMALGSPSLVVESAEADIMRFYCERRLVIGQWMGVDCEVWLLSSDALAMEGYSVKELRSVLMLVGDEEFALASRAVQMLEWQVNHQFCGTCGQRTTQALADHALQCLPCNSNLYPRISPCVIVVVVDGERCLLGRQVNWPVGQFSALAGFLEAGESAEHALHREVFEEVGVEIKNIRYVGSQAWPFPGQLMLGFLADAVTTEITVDGAEIEEAHWWHYQAMPERLPPLTTMSGRLIARFLEEVSAS
ncbi:MAG: NAD(+) diphosphatase [Porticoccaceae bacterium]|jgi:NAD+ diphosphatase|nr:NAD(+) diphosphatase [Alphaproteobacteria bacterium]MDP4745594.1 NAD(+) diphosphatase [Porticoccaceae bacterium]